MSPNAGMSSSIGRESRDQRPFAGAAYRLFGGELEEGVILGGTVLGNRGKKL